MKKSVIIFLALTLFNLVYAHQIQVEIKNEKAVVIKLYYPDGTPFAYEKFEIYPPNNEKIPFQVGRTDKLGRIVFLPNQSGKWRVKAISQDGHGIDREIFIDENSYVKESGNTKFYYLKLLVGIFLIVVIYLALNYIFRRKKVEKKDNISSE
jgi:nickel transport protein